MTTCLYEEPTEITYSVNGGTLSLSLTEAKVTVTNTVTGVTVDTIDAAKGDFALKMQTVKGCDSVIVLHIDRKVVARDTVYKDTLYAGTSYTTEFADKTFTVDHAGTYTIVDTVPGSNGCDSITVRYLIVEEPHSTQAMSGLTMLALTVGPITARTTASPARPSTRWATTSSPAPRPSTAPRWTPSPT